LAPCPVNIDFLGLGSLTDSLKSQGDNLLSRPKPLSATRGSHPKNPTAPAATQVSNLDLSTTRGVPPPANHPAEGQKTGNGGMPSRSWAPSPGGSPPKYTANPWNQPQRVQQLVQKHAPRRQWVQREPEVVDWAEPKPSTNKWGKPIGEWPTEMAPTTSWLLPCGTHVELKDYTFGPKG
jgi:hypothetical protein